MSGTPARPPGADSCRDRPCHGRTVAAVGALLLSPGRWHLVGQARGADDAHKVGLPCLHRHSLVGASCMPEGTQQGDGQSGQAAHRAPSTLQQALEQARQQARMSLRHAATAPTALTGARTRVGGGSPGLRRAGTRWRCEGGYIACDRGVNDAACVELAVHPVPFAVDQQCLWRGVKVGDRVVKCCRQKFVVSEMGMMPTRPLTHTHTRPPHLHWARQVSSMQLITHLHEH